VTRPFIYLYLHSLCLIILNPAATVQFHSQLQPFHLICPKVRIFIAILQKYATIHLNCTFFYLVIAQVRYDDPSKKLKLSRKIPFRSLLRIDVGPNRQYLVMHYLDPRISVGPNGELVWPQKHHESDFGVGRGVDGILNSHPSPGDVNEPKQSSKGLFYGVKSLVILTRDKAATSSIIDALVPTLYDDNPPIIQSVSGDSLYVFKLLFLYQNNLIFFLYYIQ
jgi:hypothetical protein